MSWQISRIEVSSFKAFKQISLDIDGSSLVTLDGPNGFGKTSIFDAIELLLTGKIKRINNLFLRLMTAYKKNMKTISSGTSVPGRTIWSSRLSF